VKCPKYKRSNRSSPFNRNAVGVDRFNSLDCLNGWNLFNHFSANFAAGFLTRVLVSRWFLSL